MKFLIYINNNKSTKMSCPACGDEPKGYNKITCYNGHIQCVKCMIKRVQAQYRMCGPKVYDDDELCPQTCFTCRCSIADDRLPPIFFSLLRLVQVDEMTSAAGMTKTQRNECFEHTLEKSKERNDLVEPIASYVGIKAKCSFGRVRAIVILDEDMKGATFMIDENNTIYTLPNQEKTNIKFDDLEFWQERFVFNDDEEVEDESYRSWKIKIYKGKFKF